MSEIKNLRLEVMKTLEKKVDELIKTYLIPIEEIWQPADILPDARDDDFFDKWRDIREEAKELSSDFWVVLVGDTVTEEALPTYEAWLMDVVGVDQHENNGWAKWIRQWTGEENRHGDILSKYLYMSGRVDMKEVEITTNYLISDGYDIGTSHDPYKNFVYTSFQELATNISHKRVGQLAKKKGNELLGKMCTIIAGDEMRHHCAYREFVTQIFKYDPSEVMIAFSDMLKKKIIMPASYIRESGGDVASAFVDFSNAAQRIGVYTTYDYIDIMRKLIKHWEIDQLTSLNDKAERARDYVMKLPDRMTRVAERMTIPQDERQFKWVLANGSM